jgi:outer membrane protein insertion porin family
MKNKYTSFALCLVLLIIYGCSNTKFLPEGELLYTGGKVKVEDSMMKRKERKRLESEFKGLLRPKPNSKILGLRPKLWIYNIAGEPKKEKGFRHWLRTKVGQPPVLFSQVDLQYNAEVLQSYSENHGYFKTRTASDSTRRGKKASAEYIVKPGRQYMIRNVMFPDDSSRISEVIARSKRRTVLKPGEGYDLDKIKTERERIDARLKEKGFYYFSPEFLKVQVDSTVGKYEVDLKLLVKEEAPDEARNVYKIDKITIFPNYSIRTDTISFDKEDVIQHNDFTIIDSAKTFNPRIFDRTLYFKKGDIYNRTDHNLSLNRLVNMGTFKFVKNEFRLSDSIPNTLNAFYFLTPLPKKAIRVEVTGKTNSANFTGTELNVNWSNRNAFRSAELLTISAFGGMEVQISGQNNGYNVYRVGSQVDIVWPRFVVPFRTKTPGGFVPKTKATIGYEFQKRMQLYALNSFKTSFGYLWKENIRKEHELNVTQINYVSPNGVTDLYKQQIEEDETGTLEKVIEKQLIFGPTYSFTYTNTMRKRKLNTFYYKGSVDVAGTIAGLVSGANVKKGDTIKIAGVPFSQFVKFENDFRHYFRLSDNSQLVSRIIVGTGLAYGNSSSLPYIKQFFIGGTNSVRAFRARSIGPGTWKDTISAFLPDESGDIKLEFNTEYRAKLFSIVHGAVFVDAGNIWLLNKNPNKPGAEFTSKFLNQLAVGTGVGLRFDLSLLILRTDLAFPLRKPYLPDGQQWVIDDIDFGSGSWRKENLIFNLAIGYPF